MSRTPAVLATALWISLATIVGARAQTLTLSPAVVPMQGSFGQSATQVLTIDNATRQEIAFTLEARDVVVRDGARAFVTAGELPDSIAATAVCSPRSLRVAPGRSASVTVTLTLPRAVRHRAVVVLFHATTPVQAGKQPAYLSLGTLFTFTVSDRISVLPAELHATAPSASANAHVEVALANDGEEPVSPSGVVVLLDARGALVGKAVFPTRRLLPGERTVVCADYAGELLAGTYQALATFDVAGRAVTRATTLVVR